MAFVLSRSSQKVALVWSNVTVEPVVFFIHFSQGLDSISEEQLVIIKTCYNDLDFEANICENLLSPNNTDINDEVQDMVADYKVYQTLAKSIFPLFFAFYVGSWCDVFGRRLIMYLFLGAQLVSQALLILNTVFMSWPKEILLAGPLITGIVGGQSAFSLALAAFISDISKPQNRALRIGFIHIATSLPRPIASPIGAWLLREGGFTCVTSVSFVGIVLGMIFLYINLRSYQWKPPQRPRGEKISFLSWKHPYEALKTVFKERPHHRRMYMHLILVALAMILVPFSGESQVQYLYVRKKFGWEVDEFSTYRSIDSTIGILGEIICIPLFAWLSLNETLVFLIASLSPLLRHILQGVANSEWVFYAGAAADVIGRYSNPVAKALLSACAPLTEFGKILSFVTILDSLIPMIIAPGYSALWKMTDNSFPGAVFLLSAAITTISVVCSCIILIHSKCERLCLTPLTSDESKTSPEASETPKKTRLEGQRALTAKMGWWQDVFLRNLVLVWRNITVEPALFLLFFSDGMDNVSVDQLKILKTCKNDFEFSDEICQNLLSGNYTLENDLVQDEASQFNTYVTYASSILPTLLAVYVGAWCDIFGRKAILIMNVSFKLVAQVFLILNSHFLDWKKEWLLVQPILISLSGSLKKVLLLYSSVTRMLDLFCLLSGGMVAFQVAVFSFLSDISTPEQRVVRMGMVSIVGAAASPLAHVAGAWILEQGGFLAVTSVTGGGIALALIYLLIILRQYHWTPSRAVPRGVLYVFSPTHPVESVKTLFKPRLGNRRMYLILLLVMITVIMAPFAGMSGLYFLYTRTRYGWEVTEFSNFVSFDGVLQVIATAVAMPSINCCNIRETTLLIVLSVLGLVRHIVQGLANKPWLFYFGSTLDAAGSFAMPITRALMSMCVDATELGKLLSCQALVNNLVPIIIAQPYASLWQATNESFPGAVMFLCAGITLLGLFVMFFIHFHLRGQSLSSYARASKGLADGTNSETGTEISLNEIHISVRAHELTANPGEKKETRF
eukprot:maker-scaffold517_size150149-snap-gene-0.20 protein:Tk02938 transcript:maker-scaffold517_size150149-snap-gene-0.20-mRNA-1 annotation:"adenylate cyclase "